MGGLKNGSILDCFAGLEDPRIERSKRHKLLDTIAIAICGANSWVHVELFGWSKEEWLKSFLELPNGIPSHDTFGEVFSRINPDLFQSFLMAWTQEIAQLALGEVVAIDGKTVRRSHDGFRRKGAIHLLSAWASANSMTLGQVKVDEESNEITSIPRLLELLTLHGCIVTIDAMGCQKEIAQQIVDAGADYVLAVKQNQGQLFEDVRDLFQGAEEFGFEGVPHDFARTVEKGHRRIESRECWVVADPGCLVLQRRFKAGCRGMHEGRRAARREDRMEPPP